MFCPFFVSGDVLRCQIAWITLAAFPMAVRAFSRNQSLPASPCTSESRLKHRNTRRHPAPSRNLPLCAPTGRPKGVVMASAPARHLRQTWVPVGSSPPSATTPARPPTPAGAPGVSSRRSNARKAWGFTSPPHWTFGFVSIGIGLRLIDPSRRQSNPAAHPQTPPPNQGRTAVRTMRER